MRKYARLSAALLCAILLFSSCKQTRPSTSDKPIRLEIQEAPCIYSDAEKEVLSARLAAICRRALLLGAGISLNESETDALQKEIADRRLAVCQAHGIFQEELDALCAYAERLLDEWESAKTDGTVRSIGTLVKETYRQALLLIGSDRVGAVLYDNTLFWLDDQITRCRDRYEAYGYDRYLTELRHFEAQKAELTARLGSEAFSDACAALLFSASALTEMGTSSEEFPVTDAEKLLFLQKQAEQLAKQEISVLQWQVMLRLCRTVEDTTELVTGKLTVLQAEELRALLDESYLNAVGAALPQWIAWYQALTARLCTEDMIALQDGNDDIRVSALCNAVLRDEAGFYDLLDSTQALASANEAEKKALTRAGLWEAYEAFAAPLTGMGREDLIQAIRTCADAPSPEASAALRTAMRGYLHSLTPYAVFVWEYTREANR